MSAEPGSDASSSEARPVQGLMAGLIEALRTRLDLAAVELEIHLLLLVRLLAWLLGAVACVMLALAFGVTAVIAALWDTHRTLALLGGCGLFVILAVLSAYFGIRSLRGSSGPLAGSLGQLAEDQRRVGGAP
ncbi:MAG TPA: phage holin family protein [Steroidobacteraceae bacterium]|nr:phage holin family protein [Steroidobacteraceae bacterium]